MGCSHKHGRERGEDYAVQYQKYRKNRQHAKRHSSGGRGRIIDDLHWGSNSGLFDQQRDRFSGKYGVLDYGNTVCILGNKRMAVLPQNPSSSNAGICFECCSVSHKSCLYNGIIFWREVRRVSTHNSTDFWRKRHSTFSFRSHTTSREIKKNSKAISLKCTKCVHR